MNYYAICYSGTPVVETIEVFETWEDMLSRFKQAPTLGVSFEQAGKRKILNHIIRREMEPEELQKISIEVYDKFHRKYERGSLYWIKRRHTLKASI